MSLLTLPADLGFFHTSLYVSTDPIVDKLDDLIAILVEEHLMHISVDAHILQADEIVFHTRLIEPLGDAGVKNAVIGALGGNREDLDVLQVHKFVNRLLLEVAGNLIRPF